MDAVNTWLYKGGRPNRVASLMNRAWGKLAAAGLSPGGMATLEVRGRSTGHPITLPVVIADYEGERYLVSMLGEGATWVANVRAAGGQATLLHGDRTPVHLDEVDPGRRAPILKRYLEVAPGGRSHIPVDYRAPVEEFEQVAANYPVFRIDVDSAKGDLAA
jgi:hypothetical protein